MYGLNEYAKAFKNGLNYVLYNSNQETRKEPVLDETSLESIGYCNGYRYGEYCEMTGQTMSISQEQLIAIIDKSHTQALNTFMKAQENLKEPNGKVK